MADNMIFDDENEEYEEYQVLTIQDDDGNVFEFALTDVIFVDEKAYAVLNLIEDDEVTSAYIIYGAEVDDENETIDVYELDEDEENEISDLYFEEVIQVEEAADEEIIEVEEVVDEEE